MYAVEITDTPSGVTEMHSKRNVMSVTCPSCGVSNSIAWGSLMATPQKEAVAMLADSWNSR